jgi:hypothetical protein
VTHIIPVYRGGKTTISNLQVLCEECHDRKTSAEKSHASAQRHALQKAHRWKTHHQKDELIEALKARIDALEIALRLRGDSDADSLDPGGPNGPRTEGRRT